MDSSIHPPHLRYHGVPPPIPYRAESSPSGSPDKEKDLRSLTRTLSLPTVRASKKAAEVITSRKKSTSTPTKLNSSNQTEKSSSSRSILRPPRARARTGNKVRFDENVAIQDKSRPPLQTYFSSSSSKKRSG